MSIELSAGNFGVPSISASDIKTIQGATDRDGIGSGLSRIWDKVCDWFCSTNRAEAKQCLFDLYADPASTTAKDKLDSFLRLRDLVGEDYKDRFQLEEDDDGFTFKLVLDMDDADDVVLRFGKDDLAGIAGARGGNSLKTFLLAWGVDKVGDIVLVGAKDLDSVCGFRNLGNTCYANSALKFLIFSMGDERLIGHLKSFAEKTPDPAKKEAAEKFIAVVEASMSEKGPLITELREFFSCLQKLDAFRGFKIVGVQHESHEFLAKVAEIFDFSQLPDRSVTLQQRLVRGDMQREPSGEPEFFSVFQVSGADAHATVQDIVNGACEPEEVEYRFEGEKQSSPATRVKQWMVSDIESFQHFNIYLETLNYDLELGRQSRTTLENTSFNDDLVLQVLDEKTNSHWKVTFAPREVIVHSGGDDGGHYYMYAKQDKGGWVKHNDSTVTSSEPGSREQARMIGFAVISREKVEP